MNTSNMLIGKVTSGLKQASFFTQLDWVQEQCFEKLGFKPFPGTLNLEIKKEDLHIIQTLPADERFKLIPPDPNFCAANTVPVLIESLPGAIVVPSEDVNLHAENILEIIAPVNVKETLNIKDGDTLKVVIKELGL